MAIYVLLGNIPTPVGKIDKAYSLHDNRRKHPHACGEDEDGTYNVAKGLETSPRLWGRSYRGLEQSPDLGNIPTPVGKIQNATLWWVRPRKHPHACGEDFPEAV